MSERPDRSAPAATDGDDGEKPAEGDGEAYSEDEEAAVAARLEDLGYI